MYSNLRAKYLQVPDLNEREKRANRTDIPMRTALQILGWNPNCPVTNVMDYYLADFENGNPPWVLSARGTYYTGSHIDEVFSDARGYSYIPKVLAKPFADKIQYDTVVTRIMYDKDSVAVIAVKNNKTVMYTGSYVVATFSSGVISGGNVVFEPKLPPWKLEAAYKIPMGSYSKVFLKFPKKFWDNSYYTLLASVPRGDFCHWQNLDRPGLYEGSHMFLVTLTGDQSREYEKLSDKEIVARALVSLRKMYGPSVPEPTGMIMHRWSQDPLTLGGYSSPVIGVSEATFTCLGAPVGERLWFTGEATSYKWNGYVHGAYLAGSQQAGQFLQCVKGGACPRCDLDPEAPPVGEQQPPGGSSNFLEYCKFCFNKMLSIFMSTKQILLSVWLAVC